MAAKSSNFPQVIPDPSQNGRNLILCFDGTGDQYDQNNSNIVRFMQLLKKDDRSKQMVYYQAGIGTGVGNAISAKVEEVIDAAVATRLPVHVRGGYEFLMQNYTEGDRISLFGFSRGAYTARALAGMLHKVGLLPPYNHEQIPFAYAMFNRDDQKGWDLSNGFKRAFSIDVKIDFLGVFDTVNSVGIIPRELPFARTNYLVRVFRHAVALDEHRAKFKPNLWGHATEKEEELAEGGRRKVYHHAKAHKGSEIWDSIAGVEEPEYEEYRNGRDHLSPAERGQEFRTDVKEVWFAGAHCDVGGGSVPNGTPSLASIPLRWMVRECFLNNTGILFHSAELHEIGISAASLWPVVKIPTPPPGQSTLDVDSPGSHSAGSTGSTLVNTPTAEGNLVFDQPPKPLVPTTHVKLGCKHDKKDARGQIYDQLSLAWWWWILEFIPLRQKYQHDDKSWFSWFSINLGRPRKIHGKKTYVHRSVQYRMQHPDLMYKPRAEISESSDLVWVD